MSQGPSTAAVVALLGLVALWTWALQLLLVEGHRHAAGALGSLTRLLLPLWGAGPVAAGLALAAFAAEPVAFVVLGAFTAVATALVTLPPRLLADRLFRRRPFEPRVRRAGVALLAAVIGAIVAVQLWPTSPCGALGQPPCRVSGGPGLAGWAGFLLFVGSAQLLVWERCMHSSPFASRHMSHALEYVGMSALVGAAGLLAFAGAPETLLFFVAAGVLALALLIGPPLLIERAVPALDTRRLLVGLGLLAVVAGAAHLRAPEIDVARFRGAERTFAAYVQRGFAEGRPLEGTEAMAADFFRHGVTIEKIAPLRGRCSAALPSLRRNYAAVVETYALFGISLGHEVVTCFRGPNRFFLREG